MKTHGVRGKVTSSYTTLWISLFKVFVAVTAYFLAVRLLAFFPLGSFLSGAQAGVVPFALPSFAKNFWVLICS